MLKYFQTKPLIDQTNADWILDTFNWALKNFDHNEFFNRCQLVQPNNTFFPGRVSSVHGKAENIFQTTLKYTGLTHWPFALQNPGEFENSQPPNLDLNVIERNSTHILSPVTNTDININLTYNPQQTGKPEVLSSNYVHTMAQHLLVQHLANKPDNLPPGGKDFFLESTEVLAIFMGFGIMFANSAYTFRGGCGSCYNPQSNRQATLSENNVLYTLALFCKLKNVSKNEATSFLKPHLKGNYKQALKQLEKQPNQLKQLINSTANLSESTHTNQASKN